ncbi:MAG: hypothetical protein ACLFQY_11865, partial [Desulfococcaceae bacterium]
RETVWESRSPPNFLKKEPGPHSIAVRAFFITDDVYAELEIKEIVKKDSLKGDRVPKKEKRLLDYRGNCPHRRGGHG